MKKLFFALAALLIGLNTWAQPALVAGGAEITFEKETHQFGNVKQHSDVSTEFSFTNTGTEPLVISNVKPTCGCTVPTWPREPILPGKKAVIKVSYDSKRLGPINKSVTVSSNAATDPSMALRIKGNIQAAESAETTPIAQPNPMVNSSH